MFLLLKNVHLATQSPYTFSSFSHNEYRLFPYTELIGCSLQRTRTLFSVKLEVCLYNIEANASL